MTDVLFDPSCPDHPQHTWQDDPDTRHCDYEGCVWTWKREPERSAPSISIIARSYLEASVEAINAAVGDPAFRIAIEEATTLIYEAFKRGNKLLICGNGGSAADAQHLAAEFVGRFAMERPPLPAVALTTDTSALTAIGNDYGFGVVFARQVRALGRPGDVLLAISTSGNSRNVVSAVFAAKSVGMQIIVLVGPDETPIANSDVGYVVIRAPVAGTPYIQQIHQLCYHAIAAMVEERMFGAAQQ